ncbi:MAG: carbohydrate ABC transporter permease [Actinobacteria bacterium]|nr:carbohydrate ABC transporter permease [Actinomycetota bacterium]
MLKQFLGGFFKYLFLAIIISMVLFPLLWVLSLAFRFPNEVLEIFPTKFTLMNIPKAIFQVQDWGGLSFLRMFFNSIFVTSLAIIGILVISSLAAFGFSNYKFRFKEIIFIAFLLGIMIPVQVMLIPLFILMKNLKLLATYFVLILPYISFGFPFGTLILRGFFEKIPLELKEAAKIDGATDLKIFTGIVLPLSKPALATVVTFSFMATWNEFLFALVFIRNDSLQTIPLLLNRMSGAQYGVQWEVYGAMIFLTVIPVIIVFIIFQRWFVAGLTSGAIKG